MAHASPVFPYVVPCPLIWQFRHSGKYKALKGGAVAQEIFLVGVALSCFGSLVRLDGAIDPIDFVSFQLLRNT
jgi:hypothetical protein